jgi:hypothetical protein
MRLSYCAFYIEGIRADEAYIMPSNPPIVHSATAVTNPLRHGTMSATQEGEAQ